MAQTKSSGIGLALLIASAVVVLAAQVPSRPATGAQPADAVVLASRVTGDWRVSAAVPVPGSKPPLPQPAVDLGVATGSTRLERILLLLAPSATQSQALDEEIQSLQDSTSSEYHQWLTPSAFADRYANSAGDVAAIVAWLRSAGFEVAALPAGRSWIEFSGTAAQVEQAFHAEIHSFATPGGNRLALGEPISVPAALKPLIHGLASLDGVIAAAALTVPEPVASSASALAAETSLSRAEAITPLLAEKLLDLDSPGTGDNSGLGESIAIAARSNVFPDDIAAFRTAFGLPASPVQVKLNGTDPGRTADEAEAVLAASWAGAVAPGAQIVLAPAASTAATDGIDLSLAAIVDQSLAHTATVGFSSCEAALSEAHQAFYAALYRQAAAEGIAVIAAAGDSGPSACRVAGGDGRVMSGYGVNALASTRWNTAVGVAAASTSAMSSGANSSRLAGWSPVNPADPAYAGGGGSSSVYTSPSWQPLPAHDLTGSGTASSHFRLLPDIALPTAVDSGVNRGLVFCLSGSSQASGCNLMRSGGSAAAAAIFSGISALLQQKNGQQGNLAPNLYLLSRQSGIFEDVEQGTARLACIAGSPGCDATGQIGFAAVSGYDLATGLGSVNAENLISQWARPQAIGTGAVNVALSFSPTAANNTYNPSATITFTATVTSLTGGATPTGTVTFFNKMTNAPLSTSPSTLDATGTASLTVEGALALGGNNIEAIYSGDSTYETLTSQPSTVTSEPSTTSVAVVPSTTTPAAGASITATATLTVGIPAAGSVAPTGKVTLNLDGLANTSATLTAGTTATFTVTIPSAGVHTLQAIYAGDTNYDASTSPAVTVTGTKGATVTALTALPTTLTPGTAETLTAMISPVNPVTGTTYTITGTVSFYDGTTLLGTGVINANSASLANVTLSAATSHIITAVYSGDPSWAASTSNPLSLVAILLGDSVALTVNPTAAGPGQVVTLTATVTPSAAPATTGEQNPTGNVIFYDGTTILGTVPLTASLNSTSVAILLNATLPGGQDTLTAVYVGDLYYATGTSNSITIDVQDFSIAPASGNPPTNLDVIQGGSNSASFVVTGLGGFNNQIQIVCAVPTQDDMTCVASPQQVTPTAVVTFTVQTYTSGGPATTTSRNQAPPWGRAAGGTALAALLFFLLPIARGARLFTVGEAGRRARNVLILLALLAGLGGAGIGCSNSVSLTGPSMTGTPLGVATLKITAASYVDNTVVSHSVYLTVNVLPVGSTISSQAKGHGR